MKHQRSTRDNLYWAFISAFVYFWLSTFIAGDLFTPPWELVEGVAFGFAWGAGINTVAAYAVGVIIIIAMPIMAGFLGSKLLKRVHMMKAKLIKYFLLALIAGIAMIALVGMYKFNYLANQSGYDVDGNTVNSQGQETIYFSESAGAWFDDADVCHTCTLENGFGSDGSVDNIIWRELVVSLKNDLGEAPNIQEVKTLMEDNYADVSSGYPVHIDKEKDNFTIITPIPKELGDIDFLDPRGVLRATYDVVQR